MIQKQIYSQLRGFYPCLQKQPHCTQCSPVNRPPCDSVGRNKVCEVNFPFCILFGKTLPYLLVQIFVCEKGKCVKNKSCPISQDYRDPKQNRTIPFYAGNLCKVERTSWQNCTTFHWTDQRLGMSTLQPCQMQGKRLHSSGELILWVSLILIAVLELPVWPRRKMST